MMDVTVVSQKRYVDGGDRSGYDGNVIKEDALVIDALKAEGLRVAYKDWADPSFDWTTTRYILIRCVWDYFVRYDEFKAWLKHVEGKTILINSAEIIHWNKHKIYLKEMAEAGVNIAPSRFFEKSQTLSIAAILSGTGWSKAVIKPCVAGGGIDTHLVDSSNAQEMESLCAELGKQQDMIVQEFQENVALRGEISLMVFGGHFSHAVLKVAKKGDFRVQDDWGGTVHDYDPTPEEISFAEGCIAACPYDPMYARVDIFNDNQGAPALAELELIEPELWFRNNPKSANMLAQAIRATHFS